MQIASRPEAKKPFNLFIANPALSADRIGFSFITPRALPVLAAASPREDYLKSIRLVDQSVEDFPLDDLRPGDLVGISIHTFNVGHGYRLAKQVRKRGAKVVFGGPHASIMPDEVAPYGDALVRGDAELVWAQVLDDYSRGKLQPRYKGGRVDPEGFCPARWDLLSLDRYLVASVQTVRGCPKQCSFCSVWVQDGRVPRVAANDAIIAEVKQLYQAGFRLIMFADDNFYPYTRQDIADARSPEEKRRLEKGLEDRFDLLERLAKLPKDLYFCTQITMEVADDPEFLAAMRRANIKGALIGIESVNEAGLKATNKYFNSTGETLVRKMERIRTEGFPYIFGSFIFGIESDTGQSLEETIDFARDCGIALAQFIPMTPLPGTVDFHMLLKGRKQISLKDGTEDYWLRPGHPRILYHHPHLQERELIRYIERAWRTFYDMKSIYRRSRRFGFTGNLKSFLAYMVVCRGLQTRYRRYGLSTESAARSESELKRRLANLLGKAALSLMKRPPLPAETML